MGGRAKGFDDDNEIKMKNKKNSEVFSLVKGFWDFRVNLFPAINQIHLLFGTLKPLKSAKLAYEEVFRA